MIVLSAVRQWVSVVREGTHISRTQARNVPELLVLATRKLDEPLDDVLHLTLPHNFDEHSQAYGGQHMQFIRNEAMRALFTI